ncbi:hypothetical protein EHP00_1603 [Ecytonucleospora hepatopenaei]|uniref:RRM domain-containing protein n=1 Tax=Ecytonucleospora hepatopenaei TaxID=646526 RepID=A0A1W0E934_9MICR|nr:hypothetical protein EHP00_1603 [Ecytonucleospora hepatopenaei]
MVSQDTSRKERKTCILGVNKATLDTTIADISKEYNSSELILVKRYVSRQFGTANFLLEFRTPEACESAKNAKESFKIKGVELLPFYAPSNALQTTKSVVSDDKLYVRYPSEVSFKSVAAKLKGLEITEAKEGNFCFIHCKDAKEQMELKQKYDGMKVDGNSISVSFAINKVRKTKGGKRSN